MPKPFGEFPPRRIFRRIVGTRNTSPVTFILEPALLHFAQDALGVAQPCANKLPQLTLGVSHCAPASRHISKGFGWLMPAIPASFYPTDVSCEERA